MTAPAGSSPRQADRWDTGRYYHRGGHTYTSVTTLISDGIPKPALIGWAAKVTAAYAVNHPGATLDEIKAARYEASDEAAKRGTDLHRWVELWALAAADEGIDWPEDPVLLAMATQWVELASRHRVLAHAAEVTVYSDTHSYAGTADMVASVDGVPSLIDIKTGSGVYPEAAMQLSALAHAEYLGVHNGPNLPMPTIDQCLVAHVRPDSARFVPVDAGPDAFRAFRAAAAVSEWVQGPAKSCIGEPLRAGVGS